MASTTQKRQPKQTNLSDDVHSQENRHLSSLLSSLSHIRIFAMRRPKPQCLTKENWLLHNVTSTTKEKWCLQFIYQQFTDEDGESPSEAYWKWAENGWNDSKPHRFPLGRKAGKPLYSLWNGKRLGYIEARKTIYAPLYAKYVEQTDAYKKLNDIYIKYCCGDMNDKQKRPMALLDFDGWDHLGQGYSLEEVIDKEKPKMGHAFVLAGLLENNLFWLSEPEKSTAEELRKGGELLKDI
ncbi:unnamed protein product [Adineta steineri]|uniref:Uncharacterized protein n=1 Tax=Adineta steineri TaxID=433720 RepID=A0A815LXD0_9BILA|nr:unnamed protein product [Adineta steineri]CAF3976547.1 unnamed protein product [Adineta steineri]